MDGNDSQSAVDESVDYTPAQGSDAPKSQDLFWRVIPYIGISAIYDDNIGISHTDPQADVILSPALGLSAEVGDYLAQTDNYLIAQAVGTELIYPQHSQFDALNQLASIGAQYLFPSVTSTVNCEYQYLTTPDQDVGGITKRALFTNALTLSYPYTERTSFELDLIQDDNVYFQNLSSYVYGAELGAKYQVTSKIKLGFSGGGGLLAAQDSPLQTYQRVQMLAAYQATGKLTFKASGGLEAYEFAGGQGSRVEPIFSLEGQYNIFPDTVLDLQGYERVEASAGLAGTDYTALGFQLTATQTLFQRINVSATIGAERNRYFAVSNSASTDRIDDYLFISPKISVTLLKHYQVSLIYELRQSQSNQVFYSYTDNRAGIQFATDF
jgi:hypothetical protein